MITSKIDKSKWGDGPWQTEPDEIEWKDEATGLPCRIIRTDTAGHLCGYVGVTPDHPLFAVDYADEALDGIRVHGNLSFSRRMRDTGPEIWWFGFDCNHSWDLAPALRRHDFGPRDGCYRDIEYVKAEVTKLAAQLKKGSYPNE